TTSLPSSGEPSALRGLAPHSILASDIVFGDGGRLRREVRIHDLARDRRGRAAAAAAVLDDDGDRDPRRLGRRVRDEEPVVAMPLVDLVLVVARILRDTETLRRAGLAGGDVLGAEHRRARRAARRLRDGDERVVHGRPMLLADLDRPEPFGLAIRHAAVERLLGADQQARAGAGAARGEDGGRMRELQRRRQRVALADAGDDRLAREPDLILRPLELLALPLTRRHDPADLAVDVDAGRRPEAERVERVGEVVDAEADGEIVEIDVARLNERVVQIDVAVPLRPPVAIAVRVARQAEEARAVDMVVLALRFVLERGKPEKRLDRRARRIA